MIVEGKVTEGSKVKVDVKGKEIIIQPSVVRKKQVVKV